MNPRNARSIVISGMIAGTPNQGGAAWAVLQYVLGLRRLGHDVVFVEPVPAEDGQSLDAGESWRYLRDVSQAFGLDGRCALFTPGMRQTAGMTPDAITSYFERADVLLNFSGLLREPALLEKVPARAYVDLDPGFTQLWQSVQGIDMGFGDHTHFITVGPAIGAEDCPIPTCGIDWIGTLQPVVLDAWTSIVRRPTLGITTVANWRGYGSVEFQGSLYGQKVHSWRSFMGVPRCTGRTFEVALSIHPDETRDLDALNAGGWRLLDPVAVSGTPDAYREFVQASNAEFGIAKSGYVLGRTGWFSDRSICYLASGRPVLAQDTGFGAFLPVGEGLMAFEDVDDVAQATDALSSDYARHSKAAREIAEAYFDSDRVLTRLLEKIGA